MLRELKERLQYWLDGVFAKGAIAQLALVLLAFLLAVLFGMTAWFLGLFSPANREVEGIARKIDDGGFWDTWWWSLKHLFDPSFFYLDQGATWPVIVMSLAMTIAGMAIFATLIGFISSSIDARLHALRKGNSIVKERGHMLILGWSNKVAAILHLLAQFRSDLTVVILAPRDIEDMQESLRVEGAYAYGLRIILRSGRPSSFAELHRVAFHTAHSIIVLAHGEEGREQANADIEAIKTLLLLSSYTGWGDTPPKMVGEIVQKEQLEVARIAGQRKIPIVSSSQIISKVIVQCSRQAHLSNVYSEIFAFAGSEIYVQPFLACTGRLFGEVLHAFDDAIPIGVSRWRTEDGVPHYEPLLNPPPDHAIRDGEWLILMARTERIAYQPHAVAAPAPPRGEGAATPIRLEQVLVIGWNSNLYDILAEYDAYVAPGTRIEVVSNYDEAEATRRLAEFGTIACRAIQPVFRRANTTMRGPLEALNVGSFDCVVVLADESHGEADPDARTIMCLVLLQDLLRGAERRPQLVSEILDPRNRELIARARVNDIIVSPQVVSMLLAQISQQKMLTSVYDELLSAGGVEIYLKPASHYVALGQPVSFGALLSAGRERKEVALGVSIASERFDPARGNGVELNPPKDRSWVFEADDRIVVLAQDLYG